MKTLKLLIAWFCYFGTGVVAIDLLTGVFETLSISPATQHIVIYLLVVMWVVKIAWFIYDKFYLERKERNLGMDKTREEIMGMKNK